MPYFSICSILLRGCRASLQLSFVSACQVHILMRYYYLSHALSRPPCPSHQFRGTYTLISLTKRNGTFWPPAKLWKSGSRKKMDIFFKKCLESYSFKTDLSQEKHCKNIFEHRFWIIYACLAYIEPFLLSAFLGLCFYATFSVREILKIYKVPRLQKLYQTLIQN